MSLVSRRIVSCLVAGWLSGVAPSESLAADAGAEAAEDSEKPIDHPIVAGFERLHADGSAPAQGGRLLLGELNCVACHKADGRLASQVDVKRAPVLDAVGTRVRPEYIRAFLDDPRGTKPGTSMPDVLRGRSDADRREAVEALTHFLAATGGIAETSPVARAIGRGRSLFRRIGCLACHGPVEPGSPRLATSVPLGDLARKYTVGGLTAFLSDPLKVRPSGRMPGLGLKGEEAGDLASYLLRELTGSTPPNVSYKYYEGEWSKLPDFAALTPRAAGTTAGFDLAAARRRSNYALLFEGYLRIEGAGEYTFYLRSDDGSRLLIDGRVAVDNDGVHPAEEKSATLLLSKGVHQLAVRMFNGGGEEELQLEYSSAKMARQPVVPTLSQAEEGPATANGAAKRVRFVVDRELAEKGRAIFATTGCASCHQLGQGASAIRSSLEAPPLERLAPRGGCLEPDGSPRAPAYHLGAVQREALAAALGAPADPRASEPAARDVVARTLTALNCYACHQRNRVGGVEEGRNEYFTTTQKEMGDEGRIPPALDGAGAKLTPAALARIFNEGAKDRPYMHTRMPRFGASNVGRLTRAFAELDPIEPMDPVEFGQPLRRVKSDGRFLAGGQALGCIKCHTFKGVQAEGVQAIDMVAMATRLRREWFHRYLLDPQAYRPGTRMPASWPMGKSLLPKVLDGDTRRQIEAIWTFLSDGSAAAEPYGLGREPMPIVPGAEPVIYRNFIRGAGPRGIAVGYPEKANLAFDADAMRLALVWQGAFIDASRHWTGRGDGFQGPLGDNVLTLPAGPSVARLGTGSDPWPAASRRPPGYQFRGYRLDTKGRPAFLYDVGSTHVVDAPEPVAAKERPGLRRTLTFTADDPPGDLWLRAAVADKVDVGAEGRYTIDGEWTLTITAGAEPVVRKAAGKVELLVPVVFNGKQATIVEEFSW